MIMNMKVGYRMKAEIFKRILSALDDNADIYIGDEFEIYEPKISSRYDAELDEDYFVITK